MNVAKASIPSAVEEMMTDQSTMRMGDIRSRMYEQRDISMAKKPGLIDSNAGGPLMLRDQIHMTLSTLSNTDIDIMLLAGGGPNERNP